MKLFLIFLMGMSFGMWCNSPSGAKLGYKAGTWTRQHVFRLPPVNNDIEHETPSARRSRGYAAMTNPKYRPTNVTEALARISEESHELGKVACKALRFGVYDMHPKKKQRNIQLLIEEWHDINDAMNDFLRLNNDCDYPPFNAFPDSKGGQL